MIAFPRDYDGILNEYDVKEAEPGVIKLIDPSDLKVEEVYIEGPVSGESYYSVPAINLIRECEYYEPAFILCYLPNEQKYATWDCDHWVLHSFENASWDDIKNDPIKYLNSQWVSDSEPFNPLEYELINGWPI
jgi:hypothetical protein